MEKTKQYIPGFDWIKLFGSTLIAMSHAFLKSLVPSSLLPVFYLLGELVPVLFIIAGFLMARSLRRKAEPSRYLWQYCGKYAAIFYIVSSAPVLFHFARLTLENGRFPLFSCLKSLALLPLEGYNSFYQLWFIFPLIAGILLFGNAFLYRKERLVWTIVLFFLPVALLLGIFSNLLSFLFPSLNFLFTEQLSRAILSNFLHFYEGIFYVGVGMYLEKTPDLFQKFRPIFWAVSLPLSLCVEIFILYRLPSNNFLIYPFSISQLLLSVLFFQWILSVKNDRIVPYHRTVTLYSGITYFLHVGEMTVLERIGVKNGFLQFLLSLAANLLLTALLTLIIRKKETSEK